MKRIFVALLAASFLATPMAASAQSNVRHVDRHVEKQVEFRNGKRIVTKHVEKRVVVKKHRWGKGQKLSRAERRNILNARDYRQYKLRAPGRGQQWVRVNNDLLLVTLATGVILGVAAAN
ncbi:RcnB family protein [Pararhizobium sp.]|uniref:RcnB family protein n=1 Tax=Pararhizobium sp. TaxID=1977563 RepID=UPI002718B12F|nr:RcnB family protein [Pararhizobium sp.]MDO9418654.1 RcnB family protein [Pararhizobium sp.]